MENTTRSFEACAAQVAAATGLPHDIPVNSSINQHLGIQAGVLPPAGKWPHIRQFMVGSGGIRTTQTTDGRERRMGVQHRVTDMNVFGPVPLVMRRTNNDLTPVQRSKFCFRDVEVVEGLAYYRYWGKRINFTGVEIVRQIHTIVNGVITNVDNFNYTLQNLSPVPTGIQPDVPNTTNGQMVTATCRVFVGLEDEWEADEFKNVSQVLYGDDWGAMASEFMLVQGTDQFVTAETGSGTFQFNEVIGAQAAAHINVDYNIALGSNLRAGTYVNIGVAEPMFIIS